MLLLNIGVKFENEYFTIIDKYMATPINDTRTHEEHHTRTCRYIFKLLPTLTVERLSITTTVNDNIHELCIHELYVDSNYIRLQAINAPIEQLSTRVLST